MDRSIHFSDDQTLWSAIRAGDTLAFRVLYETYADLLYRYGLRFFEDSDTVKDCIHDLFVDLHRYHAGLSRSVNIRFYLLGAFRRKLHEARKQSDKLRLGTAIAAEAPFLITFDIEHDIVQDETERLRLQQLSAALQALPARQKEVLYLRYHCDLSYEDIAAIMKISVPTCRTLSYRAFQQLREQLQQVPVYLIVFALSLCKS